MGLIIRFLINAAAIFVADYLIAGFEVRGLPSLLGLAVIFGLVNAVIRPLLSFVTCLVQVLTLGLFTLVLNAAMLGLSAWIGNRIGLDVHIDGFIAAILAALLIAIVSFLLTLLTGGVAGERR